MSRSSIRQSSASPLSASHSMQPSARRLPRRLKLLLRPTAAGTFWLLAVVALIATAVNYGNNLIFALAFLLLAVWLQAGWACHRHLAGLQWRANQPAPVFAGEALRLDGQLSGGRQPTAEVLLATAPHAGQPETIDRMGEACPAVLRTTEHRGELLINTLTLQSRWPLDLWQASRTLPGVRALVYPHPAGDAALPDGNPRSAHRQAATDDFQGLRAYAPGDSPRRINWRVFGRRDELAVNRFDGASGGDALWLEWDRAPGDGECRLSQLATWVLAADHAGREYGLRLPGQSLPPGRGRPHREQCLRQLALFNFDTFSTQNP